MTTDSASLTCIDYIRKPNSFEDYACNRRCQEDPTEPSRARLCAYRIRGSVAFVWINSLTGLAGLLHATGTLPAMLPLWLGVVALGALLGSQLGLHWLPVRGLRRVLGVVLLVAAGKLLFA